MNRFTLLLALSYPIHRFTAHEFLDVRMNTLYKGHRHRSPEPGYRLDRLQGHYHSFLPASFAFAFALPPEPASAMAPAATSIAGASTGSMAM